MAETEPRADPSRAGPRFLDRQGRASFVIVGRRRSRFGDLYHDLLTASWLRLLAMVAAANFAANALFALGYWLDPGGVQNARPGSYRDAFFFSVQTMATIGYGEMAPRSMFAHVLVSVEALVGLLGVAMVTGLVFAKFSRPTARVLFSRVMVIAPFNRVPSLMFRVANERSNQIVEANMRLVLARNEVTPEGESLRRFHDLHLARSSNALFALSWTAIHPITPGSPLHGMTPEQLKATRTELIASLVGLDGTMNQTVHARHSWAAEEVRWEHRFVDLFSVREDGRPQIDYSHFHEVEPLQPA